MTNTNTPSPADVQAELQKLREERARKVAEFDAVQAAEIERLKAQSEAEAKAKATEAEAAAKAADEADAKAAKAEADAKAAREKHTTLFPTASAPSKNPFQILKNLIGTLVKGWLLAVLLLVLAILAWFLFPRPNNNSVVVLESTPAVITVVVEATPQPTGEAAADIEPTPTVAIEPTKASEAPVVQPTKASAPAQPTKATGGRIPPAPAPAPITWNSGPSGRFRPIAGMICHGDVVGPYGKADGTGPVIVKFWSDQPAELDFIWASCEWGTDRSPEDIKKEVDGKYKKTFEIVNN